MNMKRAFFIVATIVALSISIKAHSAWWEIFNKDDSTQSQEEVSEVTWEDLIPDDFVQPENPFTTMTQEQIDKIMDGSDESNAELERLQEAFNYAPVVDELNGKRVKIPAYITPLEYNGDAGTKEFLLVPYLGACIHTPPPPANQVVHAMSPEAIKIQAMYDPVWAIGTIRTETVKSDLAESGYRLEVEEVLPYTTQ